MATFTIEGYNSYSGCDITVTATLPAFNGAEKGPGKYYSLGSLQTLSISTHQDKRPVRSLGIINAKDYVMGPRTIAGSMVFAVFNKHFATEIMNDLGATGTSVILPDEIPALDITINFANEYGRMSRMAIYGVKIVNEGQVMSINDLYTENTYQFVALGLEPLNSEVSSNGDLSDTTSKKNSPYMNSKRNNNVILTGESQAVEVLSEDKNYNDSSGINLSKMISNNNLNLNNSLNDYQYIYYYSNIQLTVKVEQPKRNDSLGLALFTLSPKQNNGAIYIYNKLNIQDAQYVLRVSDKNHYTISLPIGSYTAQYISEFTDSSNSVDFTIEKKASYSASNYSISYPIIEKVTNNSITVSSSDYKHNYVNCYKAGGKLIQIPIGKKPVRIPDLEPDVEYYIYTDNHLYRSEIVSVRTYKDKDTELNMFKDFITFNKDLLIDVDVNNLNFNNVEVNEYNTLIDYVLMQPESDEKQELLIYANYFTKQIITSHNKSNIIHIENKIQETPFDSVIDINNFVKADIFSYNNYKSIFDKTINPSEESFYSKPNKHYSVYGLTDNGSKSIKQDFVVCKNSAYEKLKRYCDIDKYKMLSYDAYIDQYRLNSYEAIEAIVIQDNCYSDINVVAPPYIYQKNDKVFADVQYMNLNKDQEYYLVCEELYSALDYVPHRKIPFTFNTKLLNLDMYYLGLIKNKKYLFWIEDSNYMKLSKPFLFLFETNDIYIEIQNMQKQILYNKLSVIKKEMINNYGNKTLVNDFFDYIMSCNPSDKNLINTINIELINQFSKSLYISNILDPLFELNKITHVYNEINRIPNIKIDLKNRTVEFDDLKDMYICAINYNNDEVTSISSYNDIINYGTKGYTFIYLTTNHMLYKTGFILIDNESNKYKATEDLINYIKEVGDK